MKSQTSWHDDSLRHLMAARNPLIGGAHSCPAEARVSLVTVHLPSSIGVWTFCRALLRREEGWRGRRYISLESNRHLFVEFAIGANRMSAI